MCRANQKSFSQRKIASHFTFFVNLWELIKCLAHHPCSSCVCACGPQHFLQIQTCRVSACVGFGGDGGWKGGCSEFTRTPIAWCLSRVLAFCLLSVLFWAPLLLLPSPSCVCVCVSVGWWVCLFVWIQSDTASPPAYRHTDSEITSQWQRLRVGGRRDRCTDRALAVGGWVSLTHQSHWLCAVKSTCSSSS